ncbi:hypothetical protein CDFC105_104150 [Clostridioides difficile]|nr:hypothetical protein CDFC105_104150 [Clostridioides difficile]
MLKKRQPQSTTQSRSSAASDVYKRQIEHNCKRKIKEAKELFIKLDTSKKYKTSERMIYSWELIDIKKVSDENEKNN